MNMGIKHLLVVVVLVGICGITKAEDVTKDEWSVTPYFWLPSVDIVSKLPGVPAVPVKLDFDEIWDKFDVLALSARGEYWKGKYGLVADALWMDISADGLGPMQASDLHIVDGVADLMAAWRGNLSADNPDGVSVRFMAGGRYHYLRQKIGGPVSLGDSYDWLEVVLGWQVLAPMGENWLASARGDMAGFGIGSGSELTWSVGAGVGYKFTEHWAAKLGYRYYDIDYSRGSDIQEFALDGNMNGPWIGVSYGQ